MTDPNRLIGGLLIGAFCVGAFAADRADWVHVTRPGDTLIGIATANLKDPSQWTRLQALNRVADPLHLQPGKRLRIPLGLLRRDPVGAEVLMVNGTAEKEGATGGRLALMTGGVLRMGDSLRVGSSSNVTLRFPDGARLLVLQNTTLKLGEAVRLGTTDAYRVRIDVQEGSVDSLVTPTATGVGRYEVRTPALRMAVRGTEFRTAVAAGVSRGEVVAGSVSIGEAHRARPLNAGFGTLAVAGQAPQPPRPLVGAPDLATLPARVERLPLRFAWSPVAGADTYRAQVLNERGALVLDGFFPASGAKWADLADGHYLLRVRGIAGDGLEGLDGTRAFALKARPEPPFASAPGDKAYGDSTSFRWTRSTAATAYHFQLATDADFVRLLADEPARLGEELTRALPPGQYYWRVASIAAGGDHGPFGDSQAFVQKPIPASPQMDQPETDDKQLKFRWQAGVAGQTYHLQVARNAEFVDPLVDQRTAESGIALPKPEPGEYFLRVRSLDADGFAGPFGATQQLRIEGTSSYWWILPLLLLPVGL